MTSAEMCQARKEIELRIHPACTQAAGFRVTDNFEEIIVVISYRIFSTQCACDVDEIEWIDDINECGNMI